MGSIALISSSIYILPVASSLITGGSASKTMSAVSGELPWGMYNSLGKIRFPGPVRLIETQGVSMLLCLMGIITLFRRGKLKKFWLPLGILLLGFVLSPLLIPLGILNQLLARQEAFLFIGIALVGGWMLAEIQGWLLGRFREGTPKIVPRLAIITIVLLLVLPQSVGFATYTLRWIPKRGVVSPDAHRLASYLSDQPRMVIYGEREISILIGALTHHVVPTGYISTYTTRDWERIMETLRDEEMIFGSETDLETLEEILKREGAEAILLETTMEELEGAVIASGGRLLEEIGIYRIYMLSVKMIDSPLSI